MSNFNSPVPPFGPDRAKWLNPQPDEMTDEEMLEFIEEALPLVRASRHAKAAAADSVERSNLLAESRDLPATVDGNKRANKYELELNTFGIDLSDLKL